VPELYLIDSVLFSFLCFKKPNNIVRILLVRFHRSPPKPRLTSIYIYFHHVPGTLYHPQAVVFNNKTICRALYPVYWCILKMNILCTFRLALVFFMVGLTVQKQQCGIENFIPVPVLRVSRDTTDNDRYPVPSKSTIVSQLQFSNMKILFKSLEVYGHILVGLKF
jgi:hypothetical protein